MTTHTEATPRTDVEKFSFVDLTPDEQANRNGEYVSADFARTLERENAEMRAALQRIHARLTALDKGVNSAGDVQISNAWSIADAILSRSKP